MLAFAPTTLHIPCPCIFARRSSCESVRAATAALTCASRIQSLASRIQSLALVAAVVQHTIHSNLRFKNSITRFKNSVIRSCFDGGAVHHPQKPALQEFNHSLQEFNHSRQEFNHSLQEFNHSLWFRRWYSGPSSKTCALLIREWRGTPAITLGEFSLRNTTQSTYYHFLSFYRFFYPFKLSLRSSLRQANRLRVLFKLIIMSGQVHSATVWQLVSNNFNRLLSKNYISVSTMRFASEVFCQNICNLYFCCLVLKPHSSLQQQLTLLMILRRHMLRSLVMR